MEQSLTNTTEQSQESLHLLDYWRVIISRKEIILAVLLLVVITGTAYTLTLPRMYASQALIKVERDKLDVDVFERQGGSLYDPFFLRTQYELIKAKPMLYKVVENLNLREVWGEKIRKDGEPLSLQAAASILRGALTVTQFRDTNLISIRAAREDPEEAARLANELAAVYRDHRILMKRREVKRGIEALQEELSKQQQKVAQAEAELEKLRSELNISTISGNVKTDKIQLQRLEGDRITARVRMLTTKARLDELLQLEGEELINAAAYVVQDDVISSLRRQLMNLDVNLRLLREELGENHPDVRKQVAARQEVIEKLNAALDGLKAGVRSEYEVAKTQYEALEQAIEEVRQTDIEAERDKFLPFSKAQQELDIQRSIMNALQARVVQEGIEQEVPRTPVELIELAEPAGKPYSPNIMLYILVSVVVGLLAGIILAYFLEYLDTSVKTINDVERHLGLPVIGVIPQKVGALINDGPEASYAEAYRVLRTNMQFINKDRTGGAFAVMSGGVGEGKSTTLNNLAYIHAQMGSKVLIVDSDLRRPVQHTMLGMSHRFGLTNLLLRDVPIEETIKPTKIPNLHFLASGRLPRSALGILDSQRMRELIKSLKARYEYIFFDTPPVVGISDASILASEVDGVLLVVQYRKYPRMISSRAKQMIDNVGGNLMGVVLNNINVMRDDYYYYYHSYYSHYYGHDAEEDSTSSETVEKSA